MFSGYEFHVCSPGELSLFLQNLLVFMILEQGMSMFVVENGGTNVALMPFAANCGIISYVSLGLGILIM